MMIEEYHPSLVALVNQAKERKTLLTFALDSYQQRHRLDDSQLAAYLGCTAHNFTLLQICDVPRQTTMQRM